ALRLFGKLLSFLSRSASALELHSFPTRRSSDLPPGHRALPLRSGEGGVLLRRGRGRDDLPRRRRHPRDRGRALPEPAAPRERRRSEEHTSELQSRENLVCRLLLEKKK